MASEFGEKMPRLRHGLIHMVSFHGTARAFYALFPPSEEKHRMIVALPDAPRDNSRQAFMDLRQKNHHDLVPLHMVLQKKMFRCLHPLHGQVFPAVIQVLQLPGSAHGIRLCAALQQFQGTLCSVQPSRGVQAGADDKAQVIGAQFFRFYAVDLYQCPESLIPGVFQLLQALFHKNPVLVPQLHHIADRGQRRKFQQFPHGFPQRPAPGFLCQGLCQFIGYHAPADTGKGISTLLLFGINNRQGRGQQLLSALFPLHKRHLVVIRDNHADAAGIGQGNLGCRRNAVITGYNHAHPV